MASKRPFALADVLWLFLVLAVAAGARVGYLLTFCDSGASAGAPTVQDPAPCLSLASGNEMRGKTNPDRFDPLVHNLAKDSWFSSPGPLGQKEERTAHTSPGYPWLVSWVARFT